MKKIKLIRTNNNDLVCSKNNIFSIQNIILLFSILLLILCFLSFIKIDLKILLGNKYARYNELLAMPYFSPINLAFNQGIVYYMLGDGGINNINGLNALNAMLGGFKFLIFTPVVSIILYYINKKIIKSNKLSYIFVMLQYSIIIVGASINYIMLKFLFNIIRLDNIMPSLGNTYGAFRISSFAYIYLIFNFIILILSIYSILATGIKYVDKDICSVNLFSKEGIDKTKGFVKDVKENFDLEGNLSKAGEVATDMKEKIENGINLVKEKLDEIRDNKDENKKNKEES